MNYALINRFINPRILFYVKITYNYVWLCCAEVYLSSLVMTQLVFARSHGHTVFYSEVQ